MLIKYYVISGMCKAILRTKFKSSYRFGAKAIFKCQSRKVNVLELSMKQDEFNSIQLR